MYKYDAVLFFICSAHNVMTWVSVEKKILISDNALLNNCHSYQQEHNNRLIIGLKKKT